MVGEVYLIGRYRPRRKQETVGGMVTGPLGLGGLAGDYSRRVYYDLLRTQQLRQSHNADPSRLVDTQVRVMPFAKEIQSAE